jgi:hypothetical protein
MHVAAWAVIVGVLTTLARRTGPAMREADDEGADGDLRARRNPLPARKEKECLYG